MEEKLESLEYLIPFFWIGEILALFIGVVILNFFITRTIKGMKSRVSKAKEPWKKSLYGSFERPLRAFVWLNFFFTVLYILEKQFQFDFPNGITQAGYSIATILAISWFFYLWKTKYFLYYENKVPKADEEIYLDKTLANALSKITSVVILIIALVSILERLQVSWSAIMTVIGGGTLSIGFAAKDILANFFGGLMIYINQPFKIGDWISSPDKQIEGMVEEIGWYMTIVRNFEKRPIYVPNALFPQIILVNPSRMTGRGIKHVIGIRYDDMHKVEEVVKKVRQMLRDHEDLHPEFARMAHLTEFGDFSVNLQVTCYVVYKGIENFRDIQQDILLKCAAIIEECGADMAFPTSRILFENTQEEPAQEPKPAS